MRPGKWLRSRGENKDEGGRMKEEMAALNSSPDALATTAQLPGGERPVLSSVRNEMFIAPESYTYSFGWELHSCSNFHPKALDMEWQTINIWLQAEPRGSLLMAGLFS